MQEIKEQYFRTRIHWWGGENGFYKGLKTRQMDFSAVAIGSAWSMFFCFLMIELLNAIFSLEIFRTKEPLMEFIILYFMVYTIYGTFFMNLNNENLSKYISVIAIVLTTILSEIMFMKFYPLLSDTRVSAIPDIILGLIVGYIAQRASLSYLSNKKIYPKQ